MKENDEIVPQLYLDLLAAWGGFPIDEEGAQILLYDVLNKKDEEWKQECFEAYLDGRKYK